MPSLEGMGTAQSYDIERIESGLYLGIDVGGTKTLALGSGGLDSRIHFEVRMATPREYIPFVTALADAVNLAERQTGLRVKRVAVGLPGQVMADGRRVAWVPNLRFLDGQPLAEDVASLVGAPVVLGNDARFALIGEVWRGAAVGRSDVVLVVLGTGVGGAILSGGRMLSGAHGSAGSLGWINLDWHDEPDPHHGFLERHVSGPALSRLARSISAELDSYGLVARARAGDPDCTAVLDSVGRLLGAALGSIASVLDPEVILVSGGLAEALDVLMPEVRAAMGLYASPSARQTPVVPGALGPRAGAYGALWAAVKGEAYLEAELK